MLRSTASRKPTRRKPRPGEIIVVHDDDEPARKSKSSDELFAKLENELKAKKPSTTTQIIEHDDDEDEADEASMHFRGLAACLDQGWETADDAHHHIEWLGSTAPNRLRDSRGC